MSTSKGDREDRTSYAPFLRSRREKFLRPGNQSSPLFTGTQRALLISSILTSSTSLGGLGLQPGLVWSSGDRKAAIKRLGYGQGDVEKGRVDAKPLTLDTNFQRREAGSGAAVAAEAGAGEAQPHGGTNIPQSPSAGPASVAFPNDNRAPAGEDETREAAAMAAATVAEMGATEGRTEPEDDLDTENRRLYSLGLLHAFPCHEFEVVDKILDYSQVIKATFSPDSLALVRWAGEVNDYTGPDLAFYFLFLTYYTRWLAVPAVVGLVLFIFQIVAKGVDYTKATPLWSVFIIIWCSFLLELWRWTEVRTAHSWGLLAQEDDSPEFDERPEFLWTEMRVSPGGNRYKHYSVWKGVLRAVAHYVLLAAVLVVIATIFYFHLHNVTTVLGHKYGLGGAFLGSVTITVIIFTIHHTFDFLATKLTVLKNPRTVQAYEATMSTTLFLLNVVNSYSFLFLLTFSRLKCHDPECSHEVQIELGFTFTLLTTIEQAVEVLLPILARVLKRGSGGGLGSSDDRARLASWRQARMPAAAESFEDYMELVVQFGFVLIFAPAFPLAATIAFLNNLIEIKSDSVKMLKLMRRPLYKHARGIGIFRTFFLAILIVAIVVNGAIIFFVSDSWRTVEEFFATGGSTTGPGLSTTAPAAAHRFSTLAGSAAGSAAAASSAASTSEEASVARYGLEFRWSNPTQLKAFIIFEHLLLGIVFLLQALVPDRPNSLLLDMALTKNDNTKEFLDLETKLEVARNKLWERMNRMRGSSYTNGSEINGIAMLRRGGSSSMLLAESPPVRSPYGSIHNSLSKSAPPGSLPAAFVRQTSLLPLPKSPSAIHSSGTLSDFGDNPPALRGKPVLGTPQHD